MHLILAIKSALPLLSVTAVPPLMAKHGHDVAMIRSLKLQKQQQDTLFLLLLLRQVCGWSVSVSVSLPPSLPPSRPPSPHLLLTRLLWVSTSLSIFVLCALSQPDRQQRRQLRQEVVRRDRTIELVSYDGAFWRRQWGRGWRCVERGCHGAGSTEVPPSTRCRWTCWPSSHCSWRGIWSFDGGGD